VEVSFPIQFVVHDFPFLFHKVLKKSTIADRSLKEYPQ